MQRTAITVAHQQWVNQAFLRLCLRLLELRRVLRLLRLRISLWGWLLHVRCRCRLLVRSLRFRHHAWGE